jgi:hypothetical protein
VRFVVFFYRWLALARFLITNLRAKNAADNRDERERSCKPKAKAHHCDGA